MLAELKRADLRAVGDMYLAQLMEALKRRMSRKRHVNTLRRILSLRNAI
jgi:hypothetical protein